MNWTITDETPADIAERERLLDLTMGHKRREVASERLRKGNLPAISMIARGGRERVIGTVRLWPVIVPGSRATLLLGPLAVAPRHEGRGIGSELVRGGIAMAKANGWSSVILVGAPGWYDRFGFVPLDRVLMPGKSGSGRYLLGLELEAGSLSGAYGLVAGDIDDVRVA